VTRPDTLPARLFGLAEARGDAVALREKELGIWREISWGGYLDAVVRAAGALHAAGVGPGDCVAILSDNRTEWVFADLAAQALGALSVGIYPTNPPADVAYVLAHSRSVILFAEDQEQVDKAVAIREQTPGVRAVVVFDPRGTRGLDDDRLVPWSAFCAAGEGTTRAWFDERLAERDPEAPSMVVYTSGTTGPPKGALLSPRNVLSSADAVAPTLGVGARDTLLSYLPLCHVAEKIFSLFLPLSTGAVVHFGESIATVQADLREVSPTVFLGVPRIWEKMAAGVQLRMEDSWWLPKALYRGLLAGRRARGRRGLLGLGLWILGDVLVFRALQERLGLRRCRLPMSGAAPISGELLAWFAAVGVPVAEAYGMTECGGASHVQAPAEARPGTVGAAIPGTDCALGPDGEVLMRGPHVFCGYLHDPEATAAAIDADGWLHSGDLGSLDADGFLSITGRKKEILITAGGKNLSPERIENALKASPYVKEAVAVGDGRRFVGALVQIEPEAVGRWAAGRGIAYTDFEDLSGQLDVEALVAAEVRAANEGLAPVEQVKGFRLLRKELHQDDGELTATQKVRRSAVLERHAALVEAIYGGRP
jgi:long-chain acyl-CoA synthetase